MVLSYKSNAKSQILNQFRNIRYANGEMLFGFYNNVELVVELKLDVNQVFLQADIFAREMLTHRAKFDMKRFLGQYQSDWMRILCEAYVYSRLKAIYYGIMSVNMMRFPANLCVFPGDALLANMLSDRSYNFATNDDQPYSLFVSLDYSDNITELFKPVFDICPDLEEGLSKLPGLYSYVNSKYESVLKGLMSAKVYLDNNGKSKGVESSLFEIQAKRNKTLDFFTREEVYSITGLKSVMVPNSLKEIKKYLAINTYKRKLEEANGGNDSTP